MLSNIVVTCNNPLAPLNARPALVPRDGDWLMRKTSTQCCIYRLGYRWSKHECTLTMDDCRKGTTFIVLMSKPEIAIGA